jgi:hypothetical protein
MAKGKEQERRREKNTKAKGEKRCRPVRALLFTNRATRTQIHRTQEESRNTHTSHSVEMEKVTNNCEQWKKTKTNTKK